MARPVPLDDAAVGAALAGLDSWALVGGRLRRELRFAGFPDAMAFMARVAFDAERLDHHPDWSNVYNRVIVELSTHDVGAVTELDIELARAVDRAACQITASGR